MKKIIALVLAVLTVMSLLAGCGGNPDEIVLPKQKVEDTHENRVAAILETAKAYRNKTANIQYCSLPLSVIGRSGGLRTNTDMGNTPELAGPQRTTYLTCSSYTWHTLYHSFDLRATDVWWCGVENFTKTADLRPFVVYEYKKAEHTGTDQEKLDELFSIVQPGDMLYCIRTQEPNVHAVIWGGDLTGDGEPDIIHVDGTYYNAENKEDVREEHGAVRINTEHFVCSNAYEFFNQEGTHEYFPKMTSVTVYRFAADKGEKTLKLSERAKTRILFPGLEIYHEVEGGIFGSVVQGEELTYTVRIKNNSEKNHKGILVQMPAPVNCKLVKKDGAAAKGKVVKWKVDIAAGETKELTYTVKATGSVGDVIQTGTGYVHAIPLPSLNTVIASAKPAADTVKAAIEAAKGKNGEEFLAAYLDAIGIPNAIPSMSGAQKALFDGKNLGSQKVQWRKAAEDVKDGDKALAKMLIPDYFGGQIVATEQESLRIKELRNQDLQAGDILLWKEDLFSTPMVAVHDGEQLLCARDGSLMPMQQWRLDEFMMHYLFFALRPTQGM